MIELWRSGIMGFIDERKAEAGVAGEDAGRRWTLPVWSVVLGGWFSLSAFGRSMMAGLLPTLR